MEHIGLGVWCDDVEHGEDGRDGCVVDALVHDHRTAGDDAPLRLERYERCNRFDVVLVNLANILGLFFLSRLFDQLLWSAKGLELLR